jgi:hypothetical protein
MTNYHTGWYNYTPTFDGCGSMTYTSVSTTNSQYKVDLTTVTFQARAFGTTGGSASTCLQASIPIGTSTDATPVAGHVEDTAIVGGACWIRSSVDEVECYRYDRANFGLGSSRDMVFTAIYEQG